MASGNVHWRIIALVRLRVFRWELGPCGDAVRILHYCVYHWTV